MKNIRMACAARLRSPNAWMLAPVFHLDDASVNPKIWCRFPIYSGAYRRELISLERIHKEREELE